MSTQLAHDLTKVISTEPTKLTVAKTVKSGGIFARSLAYGFDIITYLMVFFPLHIAFAVMGIPIIEWSPLAKLALSPTLITLTIVLPTYLYGGSPGKLLFDLRLVNSLDGERPPFFQILFRETIGRFISTMFIGCGYLNSLFNKDRETWHDLLARTRVVQIESDNPSDEAW